MAVDRSNHVVVRFTRSYTAYNAGDVAGFPEEEANRILRAGFATLNSDPDPGADPNVRQIQTGGRASRGQVLLGGVPVNPPIYPPRETGMGATTHGTVTPANLPVNPGFAPGPGIPPSDLPDVSAPVLPGAVAEPAGTADVQEPNAADGTPNAQPERGPDHNPEESNVREPNADKTATAPANPGATKAPTGPSKDKIVEGPPVKK